MLLDLNLPAASCHSGPDARCTALAKLGYGGAALNVSIDGASCASTIAAVAPTVSPALFSQRCRWRCSEAAFERFHRITLRVADASDCAALGSKGLLAFDVVALQPTSDVAFQHVVERVRRGEDTFDLMSVDLSQPPPLPFRLLPPQMKLLRERDVYIELCYGAALVSGG